MRIALSLTLALGLAGLALAAGEAGIPAYGWRGNGTGVYADSTPPLTWDGQSGKSIRWRASLPAPACSMPVCGPERVLVLADPDRILCYATKDGALLWERTLSAIDVAAPEADRDALRARFHEAWTLLMQGDPFKSPGWGIKPGKLKDEAGRARCTALYKELAPLGITSPAWWMTGYTACTPAANDKYVVVHHWSNVLACYDWDGNRQWMQRPTTNTKYRTNNIREYSPLAMVDGLVIDTWVPETSAQIAPQGHSTTKGKEVQEALVAYDVATGKERWRSEPLRSGGCMSAAPIPFTVGDETLIVNFGGCVVRVRDGKVVLRDIGWSSGNSPTVLGDVLCFYESPHWYGPRSGSFAYAVRIARDGDTYTATKLWEWIAPKGDNVNHRSPVAYNGKLFVPYGILFDLQTGTVLIGPPPPTGVGKPRPSAIALGGHYNYPSPFLAGGRLYLPGSDGTTRVFDADISATKPPKLLATNYLGIKGKSEWDKEYVSCHATPAVRGDCIYQRTARELLCIGETKVLCPAPKAAPVMTPPAGEPAKP